MSEDDLFAAVDLLHAVLPMLRDAATPMQSYGGGTTEDPRDFVPDEECSTEAERALHAGACAAWDRGERPESPLGHTFEMVEHEGKQCPAHVARNPWGLGTVTYRDREAEALLARVEQFLANLPPADRADYPRPDADGAL